MSNVSHHLVSGALSGFASTAFLQPFDLLKTRLQQGDGAESARRSGRLAQTIRNIVASNGITGLWRGTSASLLRNVPGIALYMTGLNQVRTAMATSPYFASVRAADASKHASVLPKLTSQGNLVAGATTRVAVGFLLNPISVLKARYESDVYAYRTLTSAFASIVRSGPSELFRGFLASSMRDAPYAGLFVVCYESIKREATLFLPPSSQASSAVIHSGSAAAAGTIATLATHPFDVIKTKMQIYSGGQYRGLSETVRTVLHQRGIAGFFDGASLRLSRKIFSSALGWAVYESVLLFIRTQPLQSPLH
ncbi:mitochondrial carrier [Dentipellis sp. KUC8613]|nr:mitochondrial carrier [Dentipellis sp. KUC8613]